MGCKAVLVCRVGPRQIGSCNLPWVCKFREKPTARRTVGPLGRRLARKAFAVATRLKMFSCFELLGKPCVVPRCQSPAAVLQYVDCRIAEMKGSLPPVFRKHRDVNES